MRAPTRLLAALFLVLWKGAAAGQEHPTLLQRHDFGTRTGRYDLPRRLDEISGLAATGDGRLFGHDDERAVVYEIDPAAEKLGKRFSLGDPPVRADFEGIAVVGERFFMVTSRGILYEFREVADRAEAPYRVSDTQLGAICEAEGLEYDPIDDALLVACKVSAPERGAIVVHRLPIDPSRGRLAPIEIPRGQLADHGIDPDFQPSAIAVDPTGTLVLVSAPFESILEADRSGRVLAGLRLSKDRHPQPEGLAFAPDGTLYISDERNGRDARITTYARLAPDGGDRGPGVSKR